MKFKRFFIHSEELYLHLDKNNSSKLKKKAAFSNYFNTNNKLK